MKKSNDTLLTEKSNSETTEENTKNKTDQKEKVNSSGALILIFIGIIFLLNNFNILPWEIWRDLWKLWPLLLIFWGIQLIFGKSKRTTFLFVLISLLAAGYFLLGGIASTNSQVKDYLQNQFPFLKLPTYSLNSPFDRIGEYEQEREQEERELFNEDLEREFRFP